MSTSSATPRADAEAVEQVIELLRGKKSSDATQLAASIGDPVARKLAEWIILRSDDNGASSERYKAFLTENPTWPSQILLRRRGEGALWDDKRDDSAVLSFFNGEQPISAKGLYQRILNVVASPRPFIRTKSYFGPDRRRNTSNTYIGLDRRNGGKAEILQQPSLLDKARSPG